MFTKKEVENQALRKSDDLSNEIGIGFSKTFNSISASLSIVSEFFFFLLEQFFFLQHLLLHKGRFFAYMAALSKNILVKNNTFSDCGCPSQLGNNTFDSIIIVSIFNTSLQAYSTRDFPMIKKK